jgi:hypothetical protein
MRRLALLSVLLFAATVARAENSVPFPEFPDPNVTCAQQFRDESAVKQCLEENQDGYNTARTIWSQMSQYTATLCANLAAKARAWASYVMLGNCASSWYYGYDVPREPAAPFIRKP